MITAAKNIYFYSIAGNALGIEMNASAKKALSQIEQLKSNKHFQGRVKKSALGAFSLACVELQISLADRISIEAQTILGQREKLLKRKADKHMKQLAVTNAAINTYKTLKQEEKYERKQRI